mmetsp:Transcript_39766/g.105334  ORF Transcript_39766/g.105334 Transcript_39766/m.105334 type:complete len:84 (+) Transcript_39766:953-1204(+)
MLTKTWSKDGTRSCWLFKNSCDSDWGKQSYIHLPMRDEDEAICGVKKKPQEDFRCGGDPSNVTVCETCGVMCDSLAPTDVHVE